MIKTTAIQLINPEPMMVTWDTGRRCNLDCTYCESTRHDNVSPHHSLDELVNTFEFIKQWTSLYNAHRTDGSFTKINFTGGEPTMNPVFWDLLDTIKSDEQRFDLGLTTNGAWNEKYTDKILERIGGVTVSYHLEAHYNLKKQILNNILALATSNVWLQVNLMLHVDYWGECLEVYDLLKSKGVKVNPRPIGDGAVEKTGWFIDADGTNRRTSHNYTVEQQTWFFEQMGFKGSLKEMRQGSQLGRACCGGRCLQGKVNNEWQDVKLVNVEFKDWQCMVDWFFLHIDQHTGLVYHHQTCQALHGGQRGPLGELKNADQMLADLRIRLENPQPIVCPNSRCGCGMCVPKAKETKDFEILWKKHTLY